MKTILFIVVLVAVGLYVNHWLNTSNPAVIEHPVFAEMRVDTKQGDREFNIALFAITVSQDDCNNRAEKTWSRVLKGCPSCVVNPPKCLATLPPRYARLFDNVAIPSTYLAFTRGSKYERDARMIVYGLTRDEGMAVCEQMRVAIAANYSGKIECIAASE